MRKFAPLFVIAFLAVFATSGIVHAVSANAMALDMAMSEDGATSMADCQRCIAGEGGNAGVAACDLACSAPIVGTLGDSGGLVHVVLLSRLERLSAGNLPLGLRSPPDLLPPRNLI